MVGWAFPECATGRIPREGWTLGLATAMASRGTGSGGRACSASTSGRYAPQTPPVAEPHAKVPVERALQPGLNLALAERWTGADPAYYTLHGYAVGGHHLALTLKQTF